MLDDVLLMIKNERDNYRVMIIKAKFPRLVNGRIIINLKFYKDDYNLLITNRTKDSIDIYPYNAIDH